LIDLRKKKRSKERQRYIYFLFKNSLIVRFNREMITTKLNLSKLLVLLTTCLVLAVSATSDNDGNV